MITTTPVIPMHHGDPKKTTAAPASGPYSGDPAGILRMAEEHPGSVAREGYAPSGVPVPLPSPGGVEIMERMLKTTAAPGPYSGDPAGMERMLKTTAAPASAPPPGPSGADILRRVDEINAQIRETYQRGDLGSATLAPFASPASVEMVQRAKDTPPAPASTPPAPQGYPVLSPASESGLWSAPAAQPYQGYPQAQPPPGVATVASPPRAKPADNLRGSLLDPDAYKAAR